MSKKRPTDILDIRQFFVKKAPEVQPEESGTSGTSDQPIQIGTEAEEVQTVRKSIELELNVEDVDEQKQKEALKIPRELPKELKFKPLFDFDIGLIFPIRLYVTLNVLRYLTVIAIISCKIIRNNC